MILPDNQRSPSPKKTVLKEDSYPVRIIKSGQWAARHAKQQTM